MYVEELPCRRFPSLGSLEATRERYRFAASLSQQASLRGKPPSVPYAVRQSVDCVYRPPPMPTPPPRRRPEDVASVEAGTAAPDETPTNRLGSRSPVGGRLCKGGPVKRRRARRERGQRHQSLPADGIAPHHLPPLPAPGSRDDGDVSSDSESDMPMPAFKRDSSQNSLGRYAGALFRDRSTTSDTGAEPRSPPADAKKEGGGASLASKLSKSFYDLTSSERLKGWKARLPTQRNRERSCAKPNSEATATGHKEAKDIVVTNWTSSPLAMRDSNPYDFADAENGNFPLGRPPFAPPGPASLGRNEARHPAPKETSFQLVSGFVKSHMSPSALRRSRELPPRRPGALAAFPLSDADDHLFAQKPPGGAGWSNFPQQQPRMNPQQAGVEMRRAEEAAHGLHSSYRHSAGVLLGNQFSELDRLLASSQQGDPNKIYEEINLPEWAEGPPPPPPAPPAPRLHQPHYGGSLGRGDPDYAHFLPPPAPITPYSGFIHNKSSCDSSSESKTTSSSSDSKTASSSDSMATSSTSCVRPVLLAPASSSSAAHIQDNEIIRPIAFKPVQSEAARRGRSADLARPVISSLSSPEPARRHFVSHSDQDPDYSDTGSSLYGLPRPLPTASTPQNPTASPHAPRRDLHSAYSSPGVPSRPRPIYHSATEPAYPPNAPGPYMGTGFAAPLPKPPTAAYRPGLKRDDYESVPDLSYGSSLPAKTESPQAKPRRFPSEEVPEVSGAAASRLASYNANGTGGSGGSRHSSGVHGVTPSPSDSGVVELEAALRTKEEELGELRASMEANEAVIIRVYQEKELRWQEKLSEWAQRLESSISTEQKLLSQIQRLQEEKANSTRQLQSLSTEKAGLTSKVHELEEQVFRGQQWVTCGKCGDAFSEPPPAANGHRHRHPESPKRGSSSERLGLPSSHSPTPAEELRGEVGVLRREVGELKDSLTGQIGAYTTERKRWEEEKAKVISYQKLLQNNYVQVFERNKRLEAIIRANRLSGATSGEESEGESKAPLPLELQRLDLASA